MELPGVSPELPTACPADTRASPRGSAKVSLLSFNDLDGRTGAARAAQAMRREIVSDLGGEDELSAMQRTLVDSVAISTAIIEDAQVRWLRGEDGVDLSGITTISNARRRDMQLLGLNRAAKDITDLDAYLASRSAAR